MKTIVQFAMQLKSINEINKSVDLDLGMVYKY